MSRLKGTMNKAIRRPTQSEFQKRGLVSTYP